MNDQTSHGLVKELQFVGFVVLDLNGLGGVIQQIALGSLYFTDNITARCHFGDGDIAALIGAVLTAGVTDCCTIGGGNLEDSPG